MRIFHAVRSDGFAGVERHVARLARAQAAAGHDVMVAGGATDRMRATVGDLRVLVVPATSTLDVVHALDRHAPAADVVHVHMTAAEVAAAVTRMARRIPPVVTTRHFASTRGSGLKGRLVARVAASAVRDQIAISRYVAEHVEGPSTVVHPGVDDRPDGSTAEGRDRTVLLVQRLEAEKRTDLALEAFAASGLAADGWALHVAGDGSRRGSLGRRATELGIADATTFLGARDDVEELMRRAAILLAPCSVEGLGLSVLEAMASGLPVVAAAAGGHLELLSGLDPLALYPADDAAAAAESLATLAAHPGRRDEYGAAAQAVQRKRYTPAAQVAATDVVYRAVVA